MPAVKSQPAETINQPPMRAAISPVAMIARAW